MSFIIEIPHILFIVYAVILGALGNVTYRAERKMPIKPISVRVLWGFFSVAIYLSVLQNYLKITELNLLNAFPIFLIGFSSELIAKKVPLIIEKWSERVKGGNNEKK